MGAGAGVCACGCACVCVSVHAHASVLRSNNLTVISLACMIGAVRTEFVSGSAAPPVV